MRWISSRRILMRPWYLLVMKFFGFFLVVPLLVAGCASADNAVEPAEETVMESSEQETRLADDVEAGEDWTDTPEGDQEGPSMGALTVEAVAANNSEESCWSIIDGAVYDLTDWISQHPGGASRILGLCGGDGTSQFQGKHGGSPSPEATLDRYLLGALETS